MSLFRNILIMLMLLCVTACSMVGRIEKVRPDPDEIVIDFRHSGSVLIRVAGGDDGFVSTETFAQALADSINATGVFETATFSGSTTYELRVMILDEDHSGLGYDHWTSSEWMLRDSDGMEIWRQKIDGKGHAIHFGGADRVRSSAERSSRAVIAAGISELGQLQF